MIINFAVDKQEYVNVTFYIEVDNRYSYSLIKEFDQYYQYLDPTIISLEPVYSVWPNR